MEIDYWRIHQEVVPGKSKKHDIGELPDEILEERQRFEDFLRSRGLRLTSQRLAVFEEVFRYHGHLDADEIAERVRGQAKGASRATVYRTLDLLVEAGLVKSIRLGSSQHFYEHVHKEEHHDHLVCLKCGGIFEFYSPELEETQDRICREINFTPQRHNMVIFGICEKCKKKGKGKKPAK